MNYSLISSERSPFGRVCRMFMLANKIDFDFQILNFVDSPADAAALAKETPINKVPILVVNGEQKIFDSRVIMNFLISRHGLPKLSVEEENIVSAVYSCMDVSVILFLMRSSGYDLEASNPYLNRQKERIPRNLAYLEAWASGLDPLESWGYPAMSLFSFLYWAERRAKTVSFEQFPWAQEFLRKCAGAPGVAGTGF